MPVKPLFMWAGGKSRLIKSYEQYLPKKIDAYYDLFFGGGALFPYMYERGIRSAVINDVDTDVMSIYTSVRDNNLEFVSLLRDMEQAYISFPQGRSYRPIDDVETPKTRYEYCNDLRHRFAYISGFSNSWGAVERSAVFYFLLKTGFNGIFQTSKKTGYYFTPPGLLNHKQCLFDYGCISDWNKMLQIADITSVNWESVHIDDIEYSFIFLDPPYRGGFTTYGKVFTDETTRHLINWFFGFNNIHGLCVNRDIGDGFFDNVPHTTVDITYTAGRRKKHDDGTFSAKKATEIIMHR